MTIAPGNQIAILAMLFWPLIALVLFKKLPIQKAIIWTFFLGMLLLPVKTTIGLPLFPDIDKQFFTSMIVLALTLIFAKDKGAFFPKKRIVQIIIFIFIVSPIFTVITNPEPQIGFHSIRPGLNAHDGIGIIITNVMIILPFLIGYRFLGETEHHISIINIVTICGLLYSLPILWELRFAPRLHSQLYGYFPHDWRQMMRDGGFRGVVFLGHGLKVAIFLVAAVICAAYHMKKNKKVFGVKGIIVLGFLLAVTVYNKSLAAVLFGFTAVGMMVFLSAKRQFKIASVIMIICLLYPFLRGADLFPVNKISEVAYSINEDRGGSLQFRFDQEEVMLARAREKQLFGWGGWGRHRPVQETEFGSKAVTDGEWLIIFGISGWAGYVSIFGLMALSVLYAYRTAVKSHTDLLPSATLAVLLAFVMIDNLINASIFAYIWLIAGALMGFADKHGRKSESRPVATI